MAIKNMPLITYRDLTDEEEAAELRAYARREYSRSTPRVGEYLRLGTLLKITHPDHEHVGRIAMISRNGIADNYGDYPVILLALNTPGNCTAAYVNFRHVVLYADAPATEGTSARTAAPSVQSAKAPKGVRQLTLDTPKTVDPELTKQVEQDTVDEL
jgi:hypothetical protein